VRAKAWRRRWLNLAGGLLLLLSLVLGMLLPIFLPDQIMIILLG
jgi:hypothetical protein